MSKLLSFDYIKEELEKHITWCTDNTLDQKTVDRNKSVHQAIKWLEDIYGQSELPYRPAYPDISIDRKDCGLPEDSDALCKSMYCSKCAFKRKQNGKTTG